MYEAMDPEERAMRRAEVADRKASRMDSKVADKYAGSEAKSAARADKKSKGKHIHGMADSYEVKGELVDETSHLEPDMNKRRKNNEKAVEDMKKTKAHADMVRAVRKKFDEQVTKEELELELRAHLRERALDTSEKKEKESVYKAIKPSKLAKSYPEKSPEELKKLRFAISTSQAKKNMDTSRSDKRYGVEG
jgi:hypothetical protein